MSHLFAKVTSTDHPNTIKMRKSEILHGLPKCVTKTKSKQILLENGTNRLAQCTAATNFQFVKKKNNKTIKQRAIY